MINLPQKSQVLMQDFELFVANLLRIKNILKPNIKEFIFNVTPTRLHVQGMVL